MDNRKKEMTKKPKVSVIVPVYSVEAYLRECIDSIVNQTLKDIEILLVDDGSTDESLHILREYENRDPRVRVFSQEHINAGAARNHGLSYATGEYLSFLDADDFFEPDMLEKAYMEAVKKNAEVVVFRSDAFKMESRSYEEQNFTIKDNNLPDVMPFSAMDIEKDFFYSFVGWAWDKLFLREFVLDKGICFQEHRTTNDLMFTYSALACAKRITILDDVLVHHRTPISTSLEATRAQSYSCFYDALIGLREWLEKHGLYKHYERDYINYCLGFSLENLMFLKGSAKKSLYNDLKNGWFKELKVTEHPITYYDKMEDYLFFCLIMAFPYEFTYSFLKRVKYIRDRML